MKSVALYARVSSEKQAQQATIDSQVSALRERAQVDGHVVLPQDVFIDDGYSGASLIRPGLERLRDRAAEAGLDIVYIHSPDRLARRYAYQVVLLEELSRAGAQVKFLNGPAGVTAEDELLVQVQGMIAEYERAKILERCRRGKIHRARQGLVNSLSGAPYGYRYIRKTDDESAQFTIELHEAKVVRQVFSWLVQEQQSIGEITRRLNTDKTPTRNGAARWDRSTVWALLRNPAYKGKAAFGKTESIERHALLRSIRGKSSIPRRGKGAHRDKPPADWIAIDVPPLISAEVFDAAAEQLERNRRLSQRNARGRRYLLQGLTVCARCGYAFYGKPVSRRSAKGTTRAYAYYRCTGTDGYRFAGGRVCTNEQVRTDQLDGYVWESVCGFLRDPNRVVEEFSRRGSEDGAPLELRQQHDEAARALAMQERGLQRLLDAYEAGALDLTELTDRSARVRDRVGRARRDLADVDAQLSATVELRAVAGRIEDFAARVRSSLDEMSWEDRRRIIRTLVARVEIGAESATVVYRVPGIPGPGAGRDHDDVDPTTDNAGAGGTDVDVESMQLRGRRHLAPVGESPPRRGG